MKAVLTLILVLFFGALAVAQHSSPEQKAHGIEIGIAIPDGTVKFTVVKTADGNELSRLYRFKNSRIKKALSFESRKNNPKLA